MNAQLGTMLSAAVLLCVTGCGGSSKKNCSPFSSASATVAGTPTGSLPSSASYSCGSINPPPFAGPVFRGTFANVGGTSLLIITVSSGMTGTRSVTSADGLNVVWGKIGATNVAAYCFNPTGTVTSDGTITLSAAPNPTGMAGSFSIPALCDSSGAVVYTNVTGSFHVP